MKLEKLSKPNLLSEHNLRKLILHKKIGRQNHHSQIQYKVITWKKITNRINSTPTDNKSMSEIQAQKTCQNYNLQFQKNIKKMTLDMNDKKETINNIKLQHKSKLMKQKYGKKKTQEGIRNKRIISS